MAMTVREKRALRRAFASRKHADIIADIIDGGSATAVADETEKVIRLALGNYNLGTSFIAALEGGTSLSAETARAFANIVGRQSFADSLITQINAIT